MLIRESGRGKNPGFLGELRPFQHVNDLDFATRPDECAKVAELLLSSSSCRRGAGNIKPKDGFDHAVAPRLHIAMPKGERVLRST